MRGRSQLLAETATTVRTARVGNGRERSCERERERAEKSDDLNAAKSRHSVGPPRPHRRIFWTRSAPLWDQAAPK